ncbi:Spo0E family sporulation regulatory protein-aspartic acid phosphatase [Neobacillus sp. LXY-4]|uniref:Spo0E family sporulation regulatory protein-aspartic acid phosphatase n=1 Tax=Neobacillus sp. LXY-4 TaxID=3379826 RepID=UPI003EE3FF77
MYQENKNLLEEINERKSKLYVTAEKNGLNLTSEETIRRSQELDQLIFQYQKEALKSLKRQGGNKTVLWSMMAIMPNVLAEV